MEYQRATKSAQKEQPKTPSSSLHQTSLNRVAVHPLLQLQRTIGNQAVLNLLRSQNMHIDASTQAFGEPRFGHDFSQIPVHRTPEARLQTKLTANQPGDVYEQEADQVTKQVMRMTDPQACVPDEEQTDKSLLYKQSRELQANASAISSDLPIVPKVLNSGGGQPLDTATRVFMEPRFGHDFSKVRVHSNEQAAESARSVNALAYTVGRDIVFGVGQYQPGTRDGQRLLAHELTHVLQQSSVKSSSSSTRTKISLKSSVPILQRFAPEWHRNTTIEALKGSFTSGEIGAIYTANWERDFSQGPAKLANMVIAWKAVKLSAEHQKNVPSASTVDNFKRSVETVLATTNWELASEANRESLGGYRDWEHMDSPGVRKKTLPDNILISRAYIKDNIVTSIDAYRAFKFGNKRKMMDSINNWQDVQRPPHYGEPKRTTGTVNSREPIAQETSEMAAKGGARLAANQLPPATVDSLGRAMHATEDFFAHSNWLEMAKELKASHQPTQTLHTATFENPDKVHAMGLKLVTLADTLLQEHDLLLKVYNLKSDQDIHEQPNPLHMKDSTTQIGDLSDIPSASNTISDAVKKGKARTEDYIVSKQFLQNLREKGESMMRRGEREGSQTGHANLAKDAPDPGKDHAGAVTLAIAADRMIFAPLRAWMDQADDMVLEQTLKGQLHLVDEIVAPPSKTHPLFDQVFL